MMIPLALIKNLISAFVWLGRRFFVYRWPVFEPLLRNWRSKVSALRASPVINRKLNNRQSMIEENMKKTHYTSEIANAQSAAYAVAGGRL